MRRQAIIYGSIGIGVIVIAIMIALYSNAQSVIISRPEFRPICCAGPDGICRDMMIPVQEQGCSQENWTTIGDRYFCIHVPECGSGYCTIKDKEQTLHMSLYECRALCIKAGVCHCDDLSSCQGDYSWRPGLEYPSYIEIPTEAT